MATIYWTGNAHSVKQIDTITVANTWAAADTVTCTINGKDLVITCGSTTTTTTTVAAAIKEAWMSATRLDGTSSSSNATSNFGGQEFGEFREIEASVSGSVVTLIGRTPGKPFTVTVTENTAGSGTATQAGSTTATGKNHWDNGDNWSGGSVPANDDVVVFKDSNVSCLYGLPNASLEVTIQVWMSYTGEVGLPAINLDDANWPYYEYRQRYVRLDDAGTGTNILHRFGLGKDGTGCRLFNLKHSTLKCSPVVYNTGTPLATRVGTKAFNICCTANTSQLNILGGSVDWSSQDGSTSAFVAVYQNGGDSRGAGGLYTTNGYATIRAGTMLVGGTGTVNEMAAYGGTMRVENQSGAITSLAAYDGGTIEYASTATVTNLNGYGGTIDCRPDVGAFTATNTTIKRGTKLYDPYRRITFTNPAQVYFDLSSDVQFGATEQQPMDVTFS